MRETPATGPIVLLDTYASAPLFPEELRAVRDAVVAQLGEQIQGRLIVEEAKVDTIAAAREGYAQCRATPSDAALERALYSEARRASVGAVCVAERCFLTVSVAAPPPGEVGAWSVLANWESDVQSAADPAQWLAAVERLQPPAPSSESGVLITSQATTQALVSVTDATAWGRTNGARTAIDPQHFAPVQPALDACHAAGWSSSTREQAVLAVAEDGNVSRCHLAESRNHPRVPGRAACLCKALQTMRFDPAETNRVSVELMNHPSSTVTTGGLTYGGALDDVTAPTGFDWHPLAMKRSLAQCHADHGGQGIVRYRVAVDVAADGSVIDVRTTGGAVAPPLERCVRQTLRSAQLPCPPRGVATLEATVRLYAHP